MRRRSFVGVSAIGGIGLMLPLYYCLGDNHSKKNFQEMTGFQKQSFKLLKTWCDAMIRDQVNNETDPVANGALYCHACKTISCTTDLICILVMLTTDLRRLMPYTF